MTHRGEAAKRLVSLQRPELLDSFLTYQNEAIQARILLHASLTELKIGSKILEVGGGILALAIQLASEGFDVTTVEPIGEGFDHILFMSDVYKQISQNEDLRIKVIEKPIEDCQFDVKFDFIFSINVMEHLKNPYSAFIKIVDTLKSGGTFLMNLISGNGSLNGQIMLFTYPKNEPILISLMKKVLLNCTNL
jgi:2-polyprenyl-3-methyl-5-hydroxy-6-metoxy-1,4-benzoquinol methylase